MMHSLKATACFSLPLRGFYRVLLEEVMPLGIPSRPRPVSASQCWRR